MASAAGLLIYSAISVVIHIRKLEQKVYVYKKAHARSETLKSALDGSDEPDLKEIIAQYAESVERSTYTRLPIEEKLLSIIQKLSVQNERDVDLPKELEQVRNDLLSARTEIEKLEIAHKAELEQIANQVEAASEQSKAIATMINKVRTELDESNYRAAYQKRLAHIMRGYEEIMKRFRESSSLNDKAVAFSIEAQDQIKPLSESTAQIEDIAALITSIADRTDNLSLNATIEAARAGEAGKGFSVVATEVKDLASKTAGEMKNIKNQIADIETATTQSVTAIHEVVGTNKSMKALFEESQAFFEKHLPDGNEELNPEEVIEEIHQKLAAIQALVSGEPAT